MRSTKRSINTSVFQLLFVARLEFIDYHDKKKQDNKYCLYLCFSLISVSQLKKVKMITYLYFLQRWQSLSEWWLWFFSIIKCQ